MPTQEVPIDPTPLPKPAITTYQICQFESFSWSEEKWLVKIYVDCEYAGEIDDSDVSFVSVLPASCFVSS